MAHYVYICKACVAKAAKKLKRELTVGEKDEFLFETTHSMNPTPEELLEARECPQCFGYDTEQSFARHQITTYVRGNGYLDRAGTRRDMNLYKLTQKDDNGNTLDPYASMREPGEADDLILKFKKAGRKGGKNKKHFAVRPHAKKNNTPKKRK